jgi:hypothetical protein
MSVEKVKRAFQVFYFWNFQQTHWACFLLSTNQARPKAKIEQKKISLSNCQNQAFCLCVSFFFAHSFFPAQLNGFMHSLKSS